MKITPISQIVFTGRPEDSNKRSKGVNRLWVAKVRKEESNGRYNTNTYIN